MRQSKQLDLNPMQQAAVQAIRESLVDVTRGGTMTLKLAGLPLRYAVPVVAAMNFEQAAVVLSALCDTAKQPQLTRDEFLEAAGIAWDDAQPMIKRAAEAVA